MFKKLSIFTLIIIFSLSGLLAEDKSLEETIEELTGKAASSYVGPIVSAFGSDLNGGWFHKAPKDKFLGLDIEIGAVVMMTTFPTDSQTFDVTGDFRFSLEQAEFLVQNVAGPQELRDALAEAIMSEDFEVGLYGPTIVGSADETIMAVFPEQDITVTFDVNGFPVTETHTIQELEVDTQVPGIFEELPALPLMAPQMSLGTIYGTQLVLRFFPSVEIDPQMGDISFFGFGLMHNPKAYLTIPVPIDVSLSFFTQKLELGNYITASSWALGANFSKQFGFRLLNITPYAGLMLEGSKMNFAYDFIIGNNPVTGDPMVQEIDFDVEGENNIRLTLGTSFRLGVLNINADYNIAKYPSITAGFGFGF